MQLWVCCVFTPFGLCFLSYFMPGVMHYLEPHLIVHELAVLQDSQRLTCRWR